MYKIHTKAILEDYQPLPQLVTDRIIRFTSHSKLFDSFPQLGALMLNTHEGNLLSLLMVMAQKYI